MAYRSVYLAKYRGSPSQRAHFAIFIPNSTNDNPDLDKDWKSKPCMGTVIHVVGEPLMKGYSLELVDRYIYDALWHSSNRTIALAVPKDDVAMSTWTTLVY